MSKAFYITTAIDYVNGQPHLGHAYEKIVTDIIARGRQSMGEEVFFLTGLDEHGQKVQQAAVKHGQTPQAYCDALAGDWKKFTATLNLSIDDFVRTTDPRHKQVVTAILEKLHRSGHFYAAEYEGYYSTKEETFLTERDRREDGTFDPHYGEVVKLKEKNYYFRLSEHQNWLIEHLESHPDFVYPDYRRNEVLGLLKNNELGDLCITRPASRLNWGIPLPFDPDFVTYVWFDALVNYVSMAAMKGDPTVLSALGLEGFETGAERRLWPADAHVIGKDILKFHAVFWPIMLKAMELPLPRRILAHGWWQKDNQKISKTTGNIVDPVEVIEEWGVDAFRYYVARELDLGPDGNWTDAGFAARYQAELANGLGNLVNRSLSMLKRYRGKRLSKPSDDLKTDAETALNKTTASLREFKIQAGLVAIWSLVARANQYVDQTAPFKLAKQEDQAARLDEVLYTLAETCRILAILLWPYLPQTADAIFKQLNLQGPPNRLKEAAWGGLREGHEIGDPFPLFPRKDLKAE